MSTSDAGLGERADDLRDHARRVGDAGQGDARLILVGGDAGDLVSFHVRS